ncbi:uncharacterized protein LOC142416871 [Mycteria americana]|uniref:uncharacterized protein LOC142416871 n=1 Tax=Mycteria americana TaxID=33587 RepID=UPI003F583A4B
MLAGRTPSWKVPGRRAGCPKATLPRCRWWGTARAGAVRSSGASQSPIALVLPDGTSSREGSGEARKVAEGCRAGVGEASPDGIGVGARRGEPRFCRWRGVPRGGAGFPGAGGVPPVRRAARARRRAAAAASSRAASSSPPRASSASPATVQRSRRARSRAARASSRSICRAGTAGSGRAARGTAPASTTSAAPLSAQPSASASPGPAPGPAGPPPPAAAAAAAASPGLRSSTARGDAMEPPPACAAREHLRSCPRSASR